MIELAIRVQVAEGDRQCIALCLDKGLKKRAAKRLDLCAIRGCTFRKDGHSGSASEGVFKSGVYPGSVSGAFPLDEDRTLLRDKPPHERPGADFRLGYEPAINLTADHEYVEPRDMVRKNENRCPDLWRTGLAAVPDAHPQDPQEVP
jgi:hypothetical protein